MTEVIDLTLEEEKPVMKRRVPLEKVEVQPTQETESEDDDDEKTRKRIKKTVEEHGFPKMIDCTSCDGKGMIDDNACDDCMCGGCGGEKWECGGC